MSCITSDTRTYYTERLARLTTQLTALETAIDSGVLHVETISLDTGEGKQMTRYRSADQMYKAQERLEARIEYYNKKLDGTGLVNLNLRRKGSGGGGFF